MANDYLKLSNSNLKKFCKSFSSFSGIFAVVIGVLVLLGWQFNIAFLKSIIPNASSMSPVTAVCFMLLGASLLIHHTPYNSLRYSMATVFVLTVLSVGVNRLGNVYWGFPFAIDQILFTSKLGSSHIAVSTAFNFILISMCLLTLRFRQNPYRHFLALLSMSISFMAIIGYLFDIHSLNQIAIYVSRALHTAITFFILSIGILCLDSEYGFMRHLTSERISGEMFRRLLPQTIGIVLALSWARLLSARLNLFDEQFGILVFSIVFLVLFIVMLWYGAVILEKIDNSRLEKEKELKEGEQRLALATQSAKMGVWEWDVISNVLIWDEQMYKLYGITAETFSGAYEAWEKGVHPQDRARAAEELQNGVSGKKDFDTEFRVLWPDRTIHHIKAHGLVVRDQDGKAVKMIGVNWDVTKDKDLDKSLADQKFALDQHSIVAITDVSGKIIYVNDKFCEISKYSRSELLGQDHRIVNSGYHPKEFISGIWRTIASGNVWKGEIKNRAKDGTIYWVDTTIIPYLNSDGKPYQYVAIRTDITERKRVDDELRLSEERYRSLFDSIDEGFCIIQMIYDEQNKPIDFRYLQVNPSFEKQTGLKDVIGKRVREVIPQLENHWFELFGKIALTGQSVRYENVVEQLSQWFDVYAFSHGELENRQVALLFNDITERKKIQKEILNKTQELERSNQELEQFAYVASHDLQEPLRMVASFTQLLERKYKDKLDEKAQEYIHFAVDGAKRMQGLIDDLLVYSKAGQRDLSKSTIDLNVVCQNVLKDLGALLEENKAVVDVGSVPTLIANETQMNQLFLNLIGNAIKYKSEKNPVIKVSSSKIDDKQWQFSVADNGIGIEEKYFDKLFVIFKRLHTRQEYKGTGIGLALCKKIVENYGGRIWIESKLGVGTTFHFTLKEEQGGSNETS